MSRATEIMQFSNTSTVPLLPPGTEVPTGTFEIEKATVLDGISMFAIKIGSRTFPCVQNSRATEAFIGRNEFPMNARFRWDGWTYKLLSA